MVRSPFLPRGPVETPNIEKFEGKFDMGWDKCCQTVLERQEKVAQLSPRAELPPRVPDIPL
jgi:hypothetical protein